MTRFIYLKLVALLLILLLTGCTGGKEGMNESNNTKDNTDNINIDKDKDEENIQTDKTDKEQDNQVEKDMAFNGEVVDLDGDLPIGMWVTPPNEFISVERYKEMNESGINTVIGFRESTSDMILAAMDAAAANNMKYLVHDMEIKTLISKYDADGKVEHLNRMKTYLSRYDTHEAYAGNSLFDEPGKPMFGTMNAFIEEFKKIHPDKLAYINLFPTYATGGIQTSSYEDYVDSWIDIINPEFISYDHYPLLLNGEESYDFYTNLSIIREKAVNQKIPFWNFIQTLQYGNTPGVLPRRDPNEAEIRWQVYNSLAFGAKGIQYFTYWTPGKGSETFGDAMIDRDGNKTERYYYVQNVNNEIKELGKILMKCESIGILPHLKEGDDDYELYTSLDSFEPIKNIEGDSAIIGCFEDEDGNKKIMVVNKSCHENAQVRISLNDISNYAIWEKGIRKEEAVTDNVIELNLEIGEGRFIEFQ